MNNKRLFIFITNKSGVIAIYSKNKKGAMNIFEEKYPKLFNEDFKVSEANLILDENGEYIAMDEGDK